MVNTEAAPIDCPFDAPRPPSNTHWDLIATLSMSSLYLSTNQTYRGYSLLVFDPRHVTRFEHLSAPEWSAFSLDLHKATRAIDAVVRSDHMNVELLGNIIQHLHWHIVPRYRTDPRWGGPIWTTTPAELHHTSMPTHERQDLITQIRAALA
jgi:diadenosine tetraphosphate (Ap4A) HIT family hydrolase